eukprot:COSAG01_NODE_53230_length_340_cov_4.174274_1_plen_61_part_10
MGLGYSAHQPAQLPISVPHPSVPHCTVSWCLLPKVLLSSTVVQTGSPIPYVRSTGSNVSKM